MDQETRHALSRGNVIDMTTTGRRTGASRRIEIVFHNLDGRIYISGMPSRRKRAWLANLEADPRLTIHLKRASAKGLPSVDLPATARVITDDAERRAIMPRIAANWRRTDVDVMVAYSPLIEVVFDEGAAA
jgi:deazaflavin-dependent oxidoreductase (nitroreductase family)